MSIQLNEDQEKAAVEIREFFDQVLSRKNKTPGVVHEMSLFGYAGTGKTTLLTSLIRSELTASQRTKIVVMAPTHKACGVLSAKLRDVGLSGTIKAMTVHSALGMRKHTDFESGEVEFRPSDRHRIHYKHLLIIDESSMVSRDLYNNILETAHDAGVRGIIWMGDALQLPPVSKDENEESPAMEIDGPRLTQIMRNSGAISDAVAGVRDAQGDTITLADAAEFGGSEVRTFDTNVEFLDDMIEEMLDGGDAVALAWTNDTVDFINKRIHRRLAEREGVRIDQEYIEGMQLVAYRAVSGCAVVSYVLGSESADAALPVLSTEQRFSVESVERATHMGLNCWALGLTIQDYQGFPVRTKVHVLGHQDKAAYKRMHDSLKEEAKRNRDWRKANHLKDSFAMVRPSWATTVHKSQGSTYKSVYIVQTDILRSARAQGRDYCQRLLYVAYSRASKKLSVLNAA